jgi:hypothetical protein
MFPVLVKEAMPPVTLNTVSEFVAVTLLQLDASLKVELTVTTLPLVFEDEKELEASFEIFETVFSELFEDRVEPASTVMGAKILPLFTAVATLSAPTSTVMEPFPLPILPELVRLALPPDVLLKPDSELLDVNVLLKLSDDELTKLPELIQPVKLLAKVSPPLLDERMSEEHPDAV